MKNHQRQSWREIGNCFNRLYNHPLSYFALLGLSYLILLAMSYCLGYLRGSSLGTHRLSIHVHGRLATRCAYSVPPELVRQTIINRVYNGTSPYENFIPRSIINSSSMANLTSKLGLETQILCLDGYSDLFMQNVVSENAAENILHVPISTPSGLAKFCDWGILGDLIEVDVGRDFYSARSAINGAYKLLKPGGVILGHNNDFGMAIKLFARVNKYRFKVNGEYWIIKSA